MVNFCNRLVQIVIVLFPQLLHSALPVQSLSDHFVCLYELVDFSSELVVLVANHSDVVVHRINFNLQISIVFEQGTVRVTSSLEFLAHIQKLVFLLTDLDL